MKYFSWVQSLLQWCHELIGYGCDKYEFSDPELRQNGVNACVGSLLHSHIKG